jgi:protein-S-isoprenylcysteine O-methyltransferase Ste14
MTAPRVPALGPRGEGWVVGQLVLLMGVAISGALALPHPALAGTPRLIAVVAGAALVAVGGWESLAGLRGLGRNLTAVPRPRAGGELVEDGVYGRVRHPIYAGIMTGSFGWALVAASPIALGFAILLAGWFDLKARREEAWLREHYPGYAGYAARTRRFVPGVY